MELFQIFLQELESNDIKFHIMVSDFWGEKLKSVDDGFHAGNQKRGGFGFILAAFREFENVLLLLLGGENGNYECVGLLIFIQQ